VLVSAGRERASGGWRQIVELIGLDALEVTGVADTVTNVDGAKLKVTLPIWRKTSGRQDDQTSFSSPH
jgi:hypothetical protein